MMEELNIGEQLEKNQSSIQEEIKSRLKSGNACYHSVENLCLPILSCDIPVVLGTI
jgi:hypothetical protein